MSKYHTVSRTTALVCVVAHTDMIYLALVHPMHMHESHASTVLDSNTSTPQTLPPQPLTHQQGAMVEVTKAGDIKPIKINTEDRQGGRKHITKVVGVESFAIEPEELAGLLQKKFAVACSTTTLPGKNNPGKEVMAQGALALKIAAFLTDEFGVAAGHITVVKK